MATPYQYGVLPEQAHEDALHPTRLLQIEERPFQRATRNLLGQSSLLKWAPRQLPSPPPEGPDDTAVEQRRKCREDVLLDMAALESSIVRIQLVQASNLRERERYAAEKAKILETAQAVRDNTLQLRGQLTEAQKVLQQRKGYDELAAKRIGAKKLKPRAETAEEIEKLTREIGDLEQESAEYVGTWAGRREAFERVVSEGQAMMRLVKGIKDEPETEKDENMEDGEEGGSGAKEDRSRMGTPAPGGGETPMPTETGGETPLPEAGDATPMRPANKFLDVEDATRLSSRAQSPSMQPMASQEDVEMEGITLAPEPETQERSDGEVLEAETEGEALAATPSEAVVESMDES